MTSIYLSMTFAQECFLLLKGVVEDFKSIKPRLSQSRYFQFNSEMIYRCMIIELSKLLKKSSNERFNVFDFVDKLSGFKNLKEDETLNRLVYKLKAQESVIKSITRKRDTLYAHTKSLEKLSFGINLTETEIADYSILIDDLWRLIRYVGGVINGSDYSTRGLLVHQSLIRVNEFIYDEKLNTFNHTFHVQGEESRMRFYFLNKLSSTKQVELTKLVDEFLKENIG